MVLLNCAFVEEGRVISGIIEEWKTVGLLKDAIKNKRPDFIKCEAHKLQLFPAKKNGEWLVSGTEDVKMLKRGGKSTLIETLTHEDKELELESGLEKLLTPQPFTGQIHVLVVIPEHLSEPSAHKKQRLEWRSTRWGSHL
ncbi:hypothetical protein PC121_g19649 [Phytophthora cactorum]|nr:hypothetical protein PC120_g19909 [Phytophthora cactorum]KAG3048150.1 hypothetical protein PC121_g19649 [Phytophthora cactorum]KAG4044165.1 hypothetical protein PC123_g20381 [Phytophthora cactorum]